MNRSERRKKANQQSADVRKFNQRKSLGTVVDKVTHQKRVATLRANVTKVMRAIQEGTVDEIELERLHNFLQWSLSLMHLSPPDMLDKAKQHAELLGLSRPDDPEMAVIWDPDKLNTLSDGTKVCEYTEVATETHAAGQPAADSNPVNN